MRISFISRALVCCAVFLCVALPPTFAFADNEIENGNPNNQGEHNRQSSQRNSVLERIRSGEVITHAAGTVEGAGFPPTVTDVNLSAHGWQRVIDNSNQSNTIFIPFATPNELEKFVSSNAANQFYFDFVRPADTVSVDYSGGVSDPALLVVGQTITRNVPVPAGRLDTRSSAQYDATRILRFNDVTLNLQRNDCRHPIDYATGQENLNLPANICSLHSWTETPTLILTFKPTISFAGNNLIDPAFDTTGRAARDFNSRILSYEWTVTWEKDLANVPAFDAGDGGSCGGLADGATVWNTVTTNNTAIRTGVGAAAAPNSCADGVASAIFHWDTQRESICYDGQMSPTSSYRDTNTSWSNVVCVTSQPVGCGMGMAQAPNGKCVSIAGTNTYDAADSAVFYPFVGGTIQGIEGSALRSCAKSGAIIMHDFSGDYGGRKKPGKGCGKSDTYHANYVFSGDKNSAASVLNLGNYSVNWSQGKDTNCMGYMLGALCSGPNYLVPTVQTLATNVTDIALATPPANMPECPAGLNLAYNPYNNPSYFATATTGKSPHGSHQLRTASSFDAGAYPVTVLAKQQLNCYQRTQFDAPNYNYNAPADQWITNTTCDYYGCMTESVPPSNGNTTYYSLYTLTTELFCREQPNVTEPTGRTVDNCNGTGRQGAEYRTYTASVGNQCGVDGPETLSCVPVPDPNAGGGFGGGGAGGGGGGGGGGFFDSEFSQRAME